MNILHVTPFFYPAYQYGGVPRLVYELSQAMIKRGHKVSVCTTDCYDAHQRCEYSGEHKDIDGIPTWYFKNFSNYLAYHCLFPLPLGMGRVLRDVIASFDIVHLWSHRHLLNTIAQRYAIKANVPTVFSAEGSVLRIERFLWQKKIFDVLFGNAVLRRTDHFVAVAEREVEQYTRAGVDHSRVSVISNGLDVTAFENVPEPGVFKDAHGLQNKSLILFIGRISSRKKVDVLIRAFSALKRDDCVLVIAGNDMGVQKELEQLAIDLGVRDKVVFTGYLNDDRKKSAYCDSSVVVYSGVDEIFGLVPFEALLCGAPVIVANDSGCGQIIAAAQAGRLVNGNDSAGLARALSDTLDDPAEDQEMVQRGKTYIQQELNWDTIAQKMEDMYSKVIADKGVVN